MAPQIHVRKLFTNEELLQLLNDALAEPIAWKKGNKFEIFFENIMAREKQFKMVYKHCRSALGEIDYVFSHELQDSFWRLSPYVCIECKNWADKIDSVLTDHFVDLVKSTLLCCCGVYITTSSYEKSAFESAKRAKAEGILIVPVERKHLKELVTKGFEETIRRVGLDVAFKG
jgi:hypothetical protein